MTSRRQFASREQLAAWQAECRREASPSHDAPTYKTVAPFS